MSKAIAILVGLKKVDPTKYNGWEGVNGCWGCELDVDNMERVLSEVGYSIEVIKTGAATCTRVKKALSAAATSLKSGDILVFYYSGHGGQQPDKNGDETDGQDETLCMYDGELIDDDLNAIWLKFRPGVRIVMVSDSCNSGTNYRAIRDVALADASPIMPLDAATAESMRAQMIHFGGCRDGATSAGYQAGGAFTVATCEVWKNGAFQGSYRPFLEAIRAKLGGQDAQYNEYGPVTDGFRNQRPFCTDAPPAGADARGANSGGAFTRTRPASGVLTGRRFGGTRGAGETPAAGGTVAKSSYVQTVAQQQLNGKFSSDPGIRLGDSMFYLPTRNEVEQLLSASQLDRRTWLAERFDCDDFAYALKGEASVHAYDTGDLAYGLCLGIVWGNFDWVSGYHAVNWFLDSTSKLWLIEPQNDTLYDASHCQGGISLLLV
ncbi:MAG: caspase family protein [Pirellulales bacterium]|nr:caspase family protein [Pirellulales bacterium]